MSYAFIKMHGLGNDFAVLDRRADGLIPDLPLRRALADRKRGIGCDQLIVLGPAESPDADVFMRMYNPDGTEAGACFNATRCVAMLLFPAKKNRPVTLQTIAGFLKASPGQDGLVEVDCGKPALDWQAIPLARAMDTLQVPLRLGDLMDPCCVSMGNPHAVFFVPNVLNVPLDQVGPRLETDPLFPERSNIEVATVIDRSHIRMRVWERRTGITQACGSGACATLVAAVRRGLTDRQATIHLDGGDLAVAWRAEDDHVLMSGPATHVYNGTFPTQGDVNGAWVKP